MQVIMRINDRSLVSNFIDVFYAKVQHTVDPQSGIESSLH